jgi:hypothetical protein
VGGQGWLRRWSQQISLRRAGSQVEARLGKYGVLKGKKRCFQKGVICPRMRLRVRKKFGIGVKKERKKKKLDL